MLKYKFSLTMGLLFGIYLIGKDTMFPQVNADEDLMYNGE